MSERAVDSESAFGRLFREWRTRRRVAIEFRKGDLELRYFSTLTSLGTPHDITLQELRVEAFFPADAATEEASRSLAPE